MPVPDSAGCAKLALYEREASLQETLLATRQRYSAWVVEQPPARKAVEFGPWLATPLLSSAGCREQGNPNAIAAMHPVQRTLGSRRSLAAVSFLLPVFVESNLRAPDNQEAGLAHRQLSFTWRSWKNGDRHYSFHPPSDVTQYVKHLPYQWFFTVSAHPGVVFVDCRDDQ